MPNARERAAKRETELGAGKFWKAPVGKFTIRILPTPASKKGEDDIFYEFNVHDKVGKDKTWLRCGKDPSGKGKCYICDKVIPQLRKKGKEERAAALEPITKMIVLIGIVSKEGKMTGPEPWLPNKKVQRALIARVFNIEKRDYTHPKKGRNLNYKRVGTGMTDTEYFGPDIDDETSEVPKAIMQKLTPFNDFKKSGNLVMPQYSEQRQKKAYLGDDAASSSEEESAASESASGSDEESVSLTSSSDSEESNKKSKKKKSSKKASSASEEESGSEESNSEESSGSASESASNASESASESS